MEHPLGERNACLDLQNEINFDFIDNKIFAESLVLRWKRRKIGLFLCLQEKWKATETGSKWKFI